MFVIVASIIWVVGVFGMTLYMVVGEAISHSHEPFWFKVIISMLWPIVVPCLIIFVVWNNYKYRKYMRDIHKKS